jgi:hypothetical protein
MMAKTFEQYKQDHAKTPYAFPMPGGASVSIVQPDLKTERAAVLAATSAGNLGDGLLAGLRAYVADDEGNDPNGYGDKIAAAWATLPTAALNEAVDEMRKHFTPPSS